MQPVNTEAQKRNPFRFIAFSIATLAMLAVIAAFLFKEKKLTPSAEQKVTGPAFPGEQVLTLDGRLHTSLQRLQDLDEQTATVLADSALTLNATKFTDSLFRLAASVTKQENELLEDLDALKSIREQSVAGKEDIGSIITGFEKALDNHRYFRKMSAIAAASVQKNAGMSAVFADKDELKIKDAHIKVLEEELSRINHDKKNVSLLSTSMVADNKKEADLQLKNKALLEDNDLLLKEINNNKRLLENAESVAKEKQVDMNKKVRELSDELILAQVNCNLSRADAKQIVYNSRQRKELLSEALAVLNNLSQSGSSDIQKKVKEKILQLQNISNTVRE